MLEEFITLFQTDLYLKIWRVMFGTWPIWLPIAAISIFISTWLTYKRREWIGKQGSVLLEIRIPKDIERTPAAMEMILEGLWEDVAGSLTDVYLEGAVRNWFSLEIVSLGGEVKFFIWTFPKWRHILESRIYAQYPGAEVVEVEDYALKLHFDPAKNKVGGLTTRLVKEDIIPIKTYVDFGLEKTDKEQEEIVDPIMPLLEYLGAAKQGEFAAVQILIQGHRGMGFQDARLTTTEHFSKGVKKAVEKIVKEAAYFKGKEDYPPSTLNLTKAQNEAVASIERNAEKHAYDAMIRLLFLVPKEGESNVSTPGIIGATRQFGYVGKNTILNGIRPNQFIPGVTYPWDDFFNTKKTRNQKLHLEAFKRRSFFNVPFKNFMGKPYVLTVEELATLFHLPGRAAATPTLARVPSKKAEAPSNLPV